jgi:DNA-binding NtrC family response regulator
MDGWETITAIRDLSETMPVIVASGYDKASLAEPIRQHGPDGFIQKPYQMIELKTKLEQLLEQGKTNQKRREEQNCQSTNAPGSAP